MFVIRRGRYYLSARFRDGRNWPTWAPVEALAYAYSTPEAAMEALHQAAQLGFAGTEEAEIVRRADDLSERIA